MEKTEFDLYKDIQSRTNGDIYIGVVGPVRTGKSTFINQFMEKCVIPYVEENFAKEIATQINEEYAMMDTSDGLADALFQIANSSNVSINSKLVEGIFGAEDYKLVATVPRKFLEKMTEYEIIGEVIEKQDYILKIDDKKYYNYDELGLYNHFEKEEA